MKFEQASLGHVSKWREGTCAYESLYEPGSYPSGYTLGPVSSRSLKAHRYLTTDGGGMVILRAMCLGRSHSLTDWKAPAWARPDVWTALWRSRVGNIRV